MKKNDPTYLAALEKAIKEKYGSATIKDFRSLWEEGKEKEYLEQLRSARLQEDKKTKCREEFILGEIKISRRRNIKKDDRTCPVCKTYSFSRRDDLYMNRFNTCYHCYCDFIEHNEDKWESGWRPSKEQFESSLRRRK